MKSVEDLQSYLLKRLPDTSIWLFGSRARGEASEGSDIDIALESEKALRDRLARMRMELEESLLPWKVDLVDLSQAPWLRETVEREGKRWR